MEYNSFVYNKPECNLTVNKMPIWFREKEYEGDENEGSILLPSQNEYDEIWGPDSNYEITWEKKDRINLFYYKEVENSINVYNAIGLVVTKKEKDWLMSHEFTFWFGRRRKMIRKRYYIEKVIHGIFYCEITERLFNLHTSIIESAYEQFEPYIIKSFKSIECH
ncbi:MAG: hypothetical protein ACXAEX_15205 [Promethearchaeota archaeon]|jgi:hypothetical protein